MAQGGAQGGQGGQRAKGVVRVPALPPIRDADVGQRVEETFNALQPYNQRNLERARILLGTWYQELVLVRQ